MMFRDTLKSITGHSYMTLFTALILIGTSVSEVWETIDRDVTQTNLGAHHGILIFGLVSLIGVVPELLKGLEELVDHQESKER